MATKAKTKPLERSHSCKFCSDPATKALIWADGRAFVPVCGFHETLGRRVIKGNGCSVSHVVALPQASDKATAGGEPEPEPDARDIACKVRLFKAEESGEERTVTGIVLEPEIEDSQTDIYSEDEVRKAAFWFMENDGALGRQHEKLLGKGARLLENFLMPIDAVIDGQDVKKGTWIMTWRVVDDAVWGDVKAGRLTGFSIGGDSIRIAEEKIQN
jgi:hypothetical protein